MKIITLLLSLATFTVGATDILHAQPYQKSKIVNCTSLIKDAKYYQQYAQSHGDTNPNIVYWVGDFNQDEKPDYLLTAAITHHCGSAGCSSELYLSSGDDCQKFPAPHLTAGSTYQLDAPFITLGYSGGKGETIGQTYCPIWKFTSQGMTYIGKEKNCALSTWSAND